MVATRSTSAAYVLSPYHAQLAAEAAGYRDTAAEASRLMLATIAAGGTLDLEWATEIIRSNRRAAERIEAQIAWERWFDGSPQVWCPGEPSWRN